MFLNQRRKGGALINCLEAYRHEKPRGLRGPEWIKSGLAQGFPVFIAAGAIIGAIAAAANELSSRSFAACLIGIARAVAVGFAFGNDTSFVRTCLAIAIAAAHLTRIYC